MAKEESNKTRPFHDVIPDEAIEHARVARRELRKSYEGLFPPEFITRRRAARREMLLALRSVINAAIERIDS